MFARFTGFASLIATLLPAGAWAAAIPLVDAAERGNRAGFAQYQPIAEGDTPDAWARNRRIELKLTTR